LNLTRLRGKIFEALSQEATKNQLSNDIHRAEIIFEADESPIEPLIAKTLKTDAREFFFGCNL